MIENKSTLTSLVVEELVVKADADIKKNAHKNSASRKSGSKSRENHVNWC